MQQTDPTSMFETLLASVEGVQPTGTEKQASSKNPFAKGFFQKVASADAEALAELDKYVDARSEAGADTETITSELRDFEASENEGGEGGGDDEGTPGTETPPGGGDDDVETPEKLAAEAEGFTAGIEDELTLNPIASALGIDGEKLASIHLDIARGEAYYAARATVNETLEKFASFVIPSDDEIKSAEAFLKQASIDLSSLKPQVEAMEKAASAVHQETATEKIAREKLAFEDNMVESLAVLQAAGFDIEKIAADAEGKKKLSGKAKAALLAGGAVAAGVAGTAGANKMLGGRFSANAGRQSIGKGFSVIRDTLKMNKGQGMKDRLSAAAKAGTEAAKGHAKRESALKGAFG